MTWRVLGLVRPERLVRPVMAGLFAAVVLLSGPMPLAAICDRLAGPPQPSQPPGQVVFVGTAVEVGSNRQNALFEVDEIWYGDVVPSWLPVYSSEGGRGITGLGVAFKQGVTYLVHARRQGAAAIIVECGDTQPYSADLREVRPNDTERPTPAKRQAAWDPDAAVAQLPGIWLAGVLVAGGGLVLVTWWLTRSRAAASCR